MGYHSIQVTPLTPIIGAEIQGVDLSRPLERQQFGEVKEAFLKHQVIFFRDQEITVDQHKAFGRLFGELLIHPAAPGPGEHPEIFVIHTDENSKFAEGNAWHSDMSCQDEPPLGSILHLHQVPSSGGDTLFSSMYAAYEALSEPMKVFLSGLTAIHESERVYRGRYAQQGVDDTGKVYPSAEHPVIRTHPETGRKALFVNSAFTARIKGLKRPESRALLRFLYDHLASPEFHCRFKWAPYSIAFWDNRCAQHFATWDYYPEVRHGLRVTVKGDRPY